MALAIWTLCIHSMLLTQPQQQQTTIAMHEKRNNPPTCMPRQRNLFQKYLHILNKLIFIFEINHPYAPDLQPDDLRQHILTTFNVRKFEMNFQACAYTPSTRKQE